jgi:hypothetical protein
VARHRGSCWDTSSHVREVSAKPALRPPPATYSRLPRREGDPDRDRALDPSESASESDMAANEFIAVQNARVHWNSARIELTCFMTSSTVLPPVYLVYLSLFLGVV